jgi:Zn-dependent protease with chaperone function
MNKFLQTIREKARVILDRERPFFSFGALAMYVLALASEAPVIFLRFLLWLIVLGIAMAIEGGKGHVSLLFVASIPTLWSVSALFRPVGGAWWWRTRAGGREPSTREQLVYQDAVELLQSYTPRPLPLPKRWFVLDTPDPDAAVCGDTLMLSRALLEMDHLPAVLAHELGHLGSPDGRLTAALNRLVFFSLPFGKATTGARANTPATHGRHGEHEGDRQMRWSPDPVINEVLDLTWRTCRLLFKATLLAKGGFGLWITSPLWGRYWRQREYAADLYAAHLGQADEFADLLEVHALIHDRPMPFIWLTDTDHDFTELRIDRLRNYAYEQRLLEPAQPAAA